MSLRAISLRTSGVTSSTFLSHTSGAAILACPGTAKETFSPSGEKRRTLSAILTHSGTDESPPRTTDAFPWRPPSAILTIIPDSRFVSMLLILDPSM